MKFTMMTAMMMMHSGRSGQSRVYIKFFIFHFYPFTILIAIMDFVAFQSLVVAKKVTARASNYEEGGTQAG